jgi:tRNA A37 threonylcarbamoyltransferase TsaD
VSVPWSWLIRQRPSNRHAHNYLFVAHKISQAQFLIHSVSPEYAGIHTIELMRQDWRRCDEEAARDALECIVAVAASSSDGLQICLESGAVEAACTAIQAPLLHHFLVPMLSLLNHRLQPT